MNMEKSRFYQQLRKYLNGELHPPEKARVDKWMDSLGSEDENINMTDAEQLALLNKIRQSIDDSGKTYTLRQTKTIRLKKTGIWLKIAATVLLLISVSFYLWTAVRSNPELAKVI